MPDIVVSWRARYRGYILYHPYQKAEGLEIGSRVASCDEIEKERFALFAKNSVN
jgi:hypothetical protein